MSADRLTRLILPMIILATASPTQAAESQALFNGKDLSGWVVEGRKEYEKNGETVPIWTVEDGDVVCAGSGYGFLRYDTPVCDFVFNVEYKMSKGCNSGIGIRGVKFTGKSNTRPSFAGYEIQVLDDSEKDPNKHSSGSLYRYVAPQVNATKPAPEWNRMKIECVGPQIRIWLNDELIQDVNQSEVKGLEKKPLCGYLSLQNHGKQITYRNVTLEVLKAAE